VTTFTIPFNGFFENCLVLEQFNVFVVVLSVVVVVVVDVMNINNEEFINKVHNNAVDLRR
jgi:hypothetical protein